MIAPRTFRALALLLACACAAALAGCSPKPQGDNKKGDDKKGGPGAPGDDKKGAPDAPTPEPKNALGAAEKAATDTATAFLRDLGNGAAKPDALGASFLKAIGKPLELPSDKEKGFSADNAGTWLKRAGDALTIGLPIKQDQVGDTVFIRGALSGPRFGADPTKTGSYCLRLVKEGAAWKVDLLTVSSADTGTVAAPQTPEGVAQAFALAAFVELTADATGLARDERGLILGALLTPELRAKLAAPFDSDRAAGLDFNRGALVSAAVKVGGGTSAFTATRAADGPTFAVELTKPAGKVRYTVKLAKGTGANEWLVSEVTEAAKG